MKRILVLLAVVCALPLIGCSKGEDSADTTQPISAKIDNNSPAAQSAGGAPVGDSPGALRKGGGPTSKGAGKF